MNRRIFIKGFALLGLGLKSFGVSALTTFQKTSGKVLSLADYARLSKSEDRARLSKSEDRARELVVAALNQPSDLLKDMEWKEGNLDDSFEHSVRTKLPEPNWR